MKKIFGFLAVAAFLAFPISADADILGTVSLQVSSTGPSGNAVFSGVSGSNWYFDYDAKINGGASMEIFCVENATGPGSVMTPLYTLITIAQGATVADGNLSNAAQVAEYWLQTYAGGSSASPAIDQWKGMAQLAVWEVYFDDTIDFDTGNFRASNTYVPYAIELATNALASNYGTGNWVWAVNPTLTDLTQYQEGVQYQNYLVQNPIPEPSTIILFGFGLLGLGIFARRNR